MTMTTVAEFAFWVLVTVASWLVIATFFVDRQIRDIRRRLEELAKGKGPR